MRKADREITDFSEQLAIIRRCDVCRLAFNDSEVPYLLPLNFGEEVVNGQLILYFHGATEGRKHQLMAADPRVSFEMDGRLQLDSRTKDCYCTMHYDSVIGSGVLSVVTEKAEIVHGLDVLVAHYHPEGFSYSPAAIPRTSVWKLTVTQLTAKRR